MKLSLFHLIVAPFFSLSVHWHPQGRMGCLEIDRARKEVRMRPSKRELYELPDTKIVKLGL